MSDYQAWDIVVVPFPFTDRNSSKRRPALVLSSKDFNNGCQQLVLAMITSAKQSAWPLDQQITDLASCGLTKPSKLRQKLFTLDKRLVLRKAGQLSSDDQKTYSLNLRSLLKDIL